MDRNTVVIIYLSILLAVTQFYWMKSEKRAAYLQGQTDMQFQFDEQGK